MRKYPEEWLKQADYDMDTAEILFNAGRYFYAVFMCHLSVEKALKGIYSQRFGDPPPRTHSLIYLVEKMKLKLPSDLYDFVFTVNRVSVPTRYPDDLEKALKDYTRERTEDILRQSEALLEWLKAQLQKQLDS